MSYPVMYVPAGDVIPILFDAYSGSTGASLTLTGLAVTDIEIYKDGSTTQRASDNGYTLLDTDGIDFDGITGIHGFSVDTGDNSDAGFYTVGAWFTVVVASVTIDSQTVNFIAAQFRIMPAEGVAGQPKVDVASNAGTAITSAAGVQEVKVASIAANAITATAINADAITAAKVADGTIDAATFAAGAINAAAIAADAITDAKVASDVTIASVTGSVGSVTGAVGSVTGAVGSVTGSVGSVVGLTAATVHSDLDDIQTRLPAALVGGRMDSNASALNGDATSAANIAKTTRAIGRGTVTVGASTTSIPTSAFAPAGAAADQFKGRIITFDADTTTTALRGQSTDITASSNNATPTFTVTALTSTPASGDTFSVT